MHISKYEGINFNETLICEGNGIIIGIKKYKNHRFKYSIWFNGFWFLKWIFRRKKK